ncbi:MAG TPA: ATP-binding protein [Pirellulales bacterium]|nr:ATP-binding protein [Pirellulales bacterium]
MRGIVSIEAFLEVAELLPEAMLLLSAEGEILAANSAASTWLAPRDESLVGKRFAELVAGDCDPASLCPNNPGPGRRWSSSVLLLKSQEGALFACRVEGTAFAAPGQSLATLLRLTPKESATSRFLELNQRIDELSRQIARQQRADELMREQTRMLETVNRIGVALAAELDLGRLMQTLTDAATDVSGAQFGVFYANADDEPQAGGPIYALSGISREISAAFSIPRIASLFEPTFHGGGVLRVADLLEDPRYAVRTPFDGFPSGYPPLRSYLAAPVISRQGKLLGGLFFAHASPGVFSERVERLVTAIAAQAAIALDNARLYRELSNSEARFRQLADAMPQMVWSASPDGATDYFNRRWYEFTGLSEGAEDDDKWPTILHPDDAERSVAAWREALISGNVYENEFRCKDRRTGKYRWHLVRALPARDAAGRIIRWFGTLTDIHELKQAQAALEESSRRKDEFLAMLGHELRNPLAAVTNAVSLLDLSDLDAQEARQAREIAQRQLQNMTRLIDDLLDVARVTRGKVTLHREVVDLTELVERVSAAIRPLVDSRRQRFELSLPSERIRVDGDPTRLEQILNNLLNNATKYTEPGGRIRLAVNRAAAEAEIRVSDDGLGMGTETLARAFDLFAQAERSLDRSQGGLGIGLTMVRSLVALHGGRVEARSEGLGKGSEFVVFLPALPREQDDSPLASAQETKLFSNNSPAPGVLLVEDNRDAAHALQLLLKHLGYVVRAVHDGVEALEVAAQFRPRIVLLDIGLPGMDGYEVARRLRAQPEGEERVLVALTGYGRDEDYRRSFEAGFNYHLTKPIQVDALQAMLAEMEQG